MPALGCAPQAAADTTPIRFAVLPIVEGLPLYAAQDGGFFEKQGVKVEFIPAGSAAERDQLIAAGQADGMINDLLAVALFNRQSAQLQVVQLRACFRARLAPVRDRGCPAKRDQDCQGTGRGGNWHLAGLDHRLRDQPHAGG